ncbi:MAG: hypothetical protein ACLT2T_08285 [Bilophila wadsworthia]
MPPAQAASLTVCNPAGQSEDGVYVDTILASSSGTAVDFPRADTETIEAAGDGLEAFNALFLARGWGDGLPLVPPTPERVKAMLAGYDLPDDFPIATLPPLDGVATVGKIAVNAVMAGCEPRHMPLLVAAVEAVSQPEFDLRGVATTTNPDSVLVIVSGPIVKRLGINAGTNTFGRGNRANACIGRALHLIISNVGGSRPSITDMSTLGQPGDFAMFLAENADASPWPSFHTEYGFLPERNVVTVAAVEGTPASWASATAALNIWISSRHGCADTTGPTAGASFCSSRRTPRRCSHGKAGRGRPCASTSGNGPASPSASGTGSTTARRRQERASPRKCSPSPIRMSWCTSRFSIPCPSSWRAARAKRACCYPAGPRGRWSAKRNPPARELGRGRALSPFLQQGLGARILQRSTQRSGMARELHSASPF